MAFVSHLRGWRDLDARPVVFHTCGNTLWPAAPFPDLDRIADSIALYHGEFVEGCVCGGADTPGCYVADAALRRWLAAQLMWNRYRDPGALVRRWCEAVYGPAAGVMEDYRDHVAALTGSYRDPLPSDADPRDYITSEWIGTAERLFMRAYALTLTDSTAHRAVVHDRLGFRWCALFMASHRAETAPPDEAEGTRTLELLDRWAAEMAAFGYDRVAPELTVAEFAAGVRRVLSGTEP